MANDTDILNQEASLLRKARRGDGDAFAALYRAHAQAIYTLAYRLTGNRANAEDIVQDTFLKMLGFLNGLRKDTPLRPWLKRVAANTAIDRMRRERRYVEELSDADWPDLHSSPDALAQTDDLLRRLPRVARTLVWLHEMEGWSHPELAERFGRSQSWSKSILSRALTRLRDSIEEESRDD